MSSERRSVTITSTNRNKEVIGMTEEKTALLRVPFSFFIERELDRLRVAKQTLTQLRDSFPEGSNERYLIDFVIFELDEVTADFKKVEGLI